MDTEVKKQKDKELLLKYLCMALPYEVIIEYNNDGCSPTRTMGLGSLHDFMYDNAELKPYLRPMSSMTDEEEKKYLDIISDLITVDGVYVRSFETHDWLLEHHFDFMGLIPKDLAIEVTESNNPYDN